MLLVLKKIKNKKEERIMGGAESGKSGSGQIIPGVHTGLPGWVGIRTRKSISEWVLSGSGSGPGITYPLTPLILGIL